MELYKVGKMQMALSTKTFSGLAKVAIFTTNVDAENQTLINHKCVCGALNRHFCQTRVIARFISSILFHLYNVLCHLVGFPYRLYTLVLNDNESEILSDQQILRNSCQYYNHQVCVPFR